jgi:hypothetical protein
LVRSAAVRTMRDTFSRHYPRCRPCRYCTTAPLRWTTRTSRSTPRTALATLGVKPHLGDSLRYWPGYHHLRAGSCTGTSRTSSSLTTTTTGRRRTVSGTLPGLPSHPLHRAVGSCTWTPSRSTATTPTASQRDEPHLGCSRWYYRTYSAVHYTDFDSLVLFTYTAAAAVRRVRLCLGHSHLTTRRYAVQRPGRPHAPWQPYRHRRTVGEPHLGLSHSPPTAPLAALPACHVKSASAPPSLPPAALPTIPAAMVHGLRPARALCSRHRCRQTESVPLPGPLSPLLPTARTATAPPPPAAVLTTDRTTGCATNQVACSLCPRRRGLPRQLCHQCTLGL